MRKLYPFMFLAFITIHSESNSVQSYEYLLMFLPSIQDVNGFEKSDITIDEPCPECLPTIYVTYHKAGKGDMGEDYSDLGKTISTIITDCKNAADYLNSMLEIGSESQSPFIVLEKYKGIKEIEQNESGVQQCGYTYSVADRFLIQIFGGSGDLFNEINILLNNINHSAMENFK